MIMTSRRTFLTRTTLGGFAASLRAAPAARDKALIALTFDLEMSRNFPTWDQTHWDYEKGNLDEATKRYSLQVARRVRERGAAMHFFAVGRVFEQEDVGWLREIAGMGHAIGNHTYDHVNVLATRAEDIQPRFRRAPWLLDDKPPLDFIRRNVRMTSEAMRQRLGIFPSGFRTPGGFPNGLAGRHDVQRMLKEEGFAWVSGKYARHPLGRLGEAPSPAVYDAIREAQRESQPFRYPETGLLEIPMSPISDIGAFRGGRWRLESFLRAIRVAVEWAIEHRAVYDFLGHPSCLVATDPRMESVDLILDLVRDAGKQAEAVTLDKIAAQPGSEG